MSVVRLLFGFGLISGLSVLAWHGKEVSNYHVVDSSTIQGVNKELNSLYGEYKVSDLKIDSKQVILLTGPIGMPSLFSGASNLDIPSRILALSKNHKPIYLLIDSPGGSVMDGAMIISAMQGAGVPVYTVCTKLCASMAFIIHQYGTKRFMIDRAVLMAHPASAGVEGTIEQMHSRLAFLERFTGKLNAGISKRAGITSEQFKSQYLVEQWLDAEDSTASHFNDSIVTLKVDGGEFSLSEMLPPETTPDKDKNSKIVVPKVMPLINI
jgi:ATP-dependent Clp protease protease subunit